MNIYIGIDFSLNSTAMSIIDDNTLNVISVFKTDNNINNMFSRNDHFGLLNSSSEVNLILLEKNKTKSKEYCEVERNKIKLFIELNNFIISSISKFTKNPDVYIAMEGISFGSSGNSLIDISIATGILRNGILDILDKDFDRFFVFSPTTIKKFAGKGNFKKIDMLNSLILNNKENYTLVDLLRSNTDLIVTSSGVVKKPIEDIVDSIWIAKFLKESIENVQI